MEFSELTIWSAALWLLAAIVKFVVTPSAMIASGFSAWIAWMLTSTGAFVGVWLFWDFGKWGFQRWEDRRPSRAERGKPIFTPQRRRIVRWKNSWGWPGLLVVCGLISVPLASMIGAKYFREEPFAKFQLMLAFALWAGMLSGLSMAIKQGLL